MIQISERKYTKYCKPNFAVQKTISQKNLYDDIDYKVEIKSQLKFNSNAVGFSGARTWQSMATGTLSDLCQLIDGLKVFKMVHEDCALFAI